MSAPPVSSAPALLTLDEFAALPNADEPMELVRGEVRPMPAAEAPEAVVTSNLVGLLMEHVHPRRMGRVFGPNAGFALLPARQTCRSPDVALLRAERVPERVPAGLIRIVPDLVVEVLSPSETASILEDKLADYREAGTPLIWVVDPEFRHVVVHPADAPSSTLREGDTLTGGRVLPDFRCAVAELFEGI